MASGKAFLGAGRKGAVEEDDTEGAQEIPGKKEGIGGTSEVTELAGGLDGEKTAETCESNGYQQCRDRAEHRKENELFVLAQDGETGLDEVGSHEGLPL
jgi:hypothetical protein